MGTLAQGARNAIETCMAVRSGESVVLVTDRLVPEVGDALEAAARARTDKVERFVLEELGERPLKALPKTLARAAETADVSLWAAASVAGELPVRMAYRAHLKAARHGHMPGISVELMEQGMNADYDAVADLTTRLHKRLDGARHAHVKNRYGADFEVVLHPRWKWLADTGKFHAPGSWGNLPAGEVYTAPAWLHGRVVTHLLGDHFSERYGVLDPPLSFDVLDSRVDLDSLEGGPRGLVQEFRDYLTSDTMGMRAGEFALGTNLALTKLVGNLLQDEKIPGVHVAFGHPYSEQTGAPWTAKTHVDAVILETDVDIDGAPVQRGGRYVF